MRGHRRSIVQSDFYREPNAFGILNDFVRPEADDSPPFALHDGCAVCIRFDLKRVMLAVDLDH